MRRLSLAVLCGMALTLFTVSCAESDLGITTKVKSRLETERNINASQITVTTKNKVVSLSGPVDSPATKDRAVTIAKGVEGVKNVVDDMTVSTAVAEMPKSAAGTNAAPSDSAIAQAVERNLKADPSTANDQIEVQTEGGVVTLTGTVKSSEEKEHVVQIARGTDGVQRVEDKLSVASS
jgi:hyperosmotically inducible periplasmic protein